MGCRHPGYGAPRRSGVTQRVRDAAGAGDVGLQMVRDWVVRVDVRGPEGLIDPKGSGRPPSCKGNVGITALGLHTNAGQASM